jgi:hypothetical protein
MNRFVVSIFLLFNFLFSINTANAVYLLVNTEDRRGIHPLSTEELKKAFAIVRAGEWAFVRAELIRNPERAKADLRDYLSTSRTDAEIINAELLKFRPNGSLKVQWIPTTLWNLITIREFVNNPEYRKFLNECGAPADASDYGATAQWEKFIEDEDAVEKIYKRTAEVVIQFLNRTDVQKSTVHEFILKILNDIWNGDQPLYRDVFGKEFLDIENGRISFLQQAIEEEIQAYTNKYTLLWRATSGITFEEITASMKKVSPWDKILFKHHEEMVLLAKEANRAVNLLRPGLTREEVQILNCLLASGKMDKRFGYYYPKPILPYRWKAIEILDYPMRALQRVSNLLNFQIYGQNSTMETTSVDLSYSFSPLDGFLFDGPDVDKSACTYVFARRDHASYTYVLHVDRKWEIERGRHLFYYPVTPDFMGVFSAGELFHPRVRQMPGVGRVLHPFKYDGILSANRQDFESEVEPSVFKALTLKVHTELAALYENNSLERSEEIAKDLLIHAKFSEELGTLLATRAKIVQIDDSGVSGDSDPRVAELRINQNAASSLWLNFLKMEPVRAQIRLLRKE